MGEAAWGSGWMETGRAVASWECYENSSSKGLNITAII